MNVIDCDLVLYPRFHDGWVVFDRWFYRSGKVVQRIIYDTNAKKPKRTFPSFYFTQPRDYIQSVDKKYFRKHTDFFDREITGDEYNKRVTHLATDMIRETVRVCKVNKVKFSEKLFICPISGIVWKGGAFHNPWPHYRENHVERPFYLKAYRNDSCSEVLYISKSIQEHFELISWSNHSSRNRGVGLCSLNKKVMRDAAMFGFLGAPYDHDWSSRMSKFQKPNPRHFIFQLFCKSESMKVRKEDVIKSAARYIKKISRVAPLSEATKKFFKTLGALAHIKKAATYATQT